MQRQEALRAALDGARTLAELERVVQDTLQWTEQDGAGAGAGAEAEAGVGAPTDDG